MRFTSDDAARLRAAMQQVLASERLPGLAVAVVQGDETVFAEAVGHAEIETKQPLTPEHRHRIASVTKTMVGLCVMALVDEGRLSLEDRIVDRLPDIRFNGPAERLTVRHLLTHTGGIGEAPNVEDLRDPIAFLFTDGQPDKPLAERYDKGITIECPPGAKWCYANHGYMLLGELVRRIEDAPLQDILDRRIFRPLGMNDTDAGDLPHPALAAGYHRAPDEDTVELMRRVGREPPDETPIDGVNIRSKFQPFWDHAAGGVQSTLLDMARYAAALLRRCPGIVRPETFDAMIAPAWRPDPVLPGWGLSFCLRDVGGRQSFGHDGNALGWNSYLCVIPSEDLAIVIHTNLSYSGFNSHVVGPLVNAALGLPPFSAEPEPLDPLTRETAPGVYEAPLPGPLTNFRTMTGTGRIQISLRSDDGGESGLVLYARRGAWKAGYPLVPARRSAGNDGESADLFAIHTGEASPTLVRLLRDGTGAVTGIHLPLLTIMRKNPDIAPWI
jgi:beta-lactamase class C